MRPFSSHRKQQKIIKRPDVTPLAVRFWTVTKFPNYVIVYRPETVPLQLIAALHGKHDQKQVLSRSS